jgi:hypothetical protein
MRDVKTVELTTDEVSGNHLNGFPLTVGLPVPPGALPAGEPLAILDASGEAAGVQSRVLETHEDGSVRWLLVDFLADLAPLSQARHRLVIGRRAPAPACRIELHKAGGLTVIDNGPLRIEVDTARCRPTTRVWLDGQPISEGPLEFRVTGEDGKVYSAANDPDCRFEIEEPGPLRLRMRWDATHVADDDSRHFDFIVRLTVYAGQPFVRLDHVLINRLDATVTNVREVAAVFPHRLPGELRYTAAGGYRPPSQVACDGPTWLEMFKLGQSHLRGSDGTLKHDLRNASMGWIDASGEGRGVHLIGKAFWQNFPKLLSVDATTISAGLIPDRGGLGAFPVPRGMAKTHTFFLYFHRAGAEPTQLWERAFAVQRWPMPRASGEHYLASGELWDFFPSKPDKYPRLEAAMRQFFDANQNNAPTNRYPGKVYGLKHYGDFLCADGPAGSNPDPDHPGAYFINNEYDTSHVLAMLFLRSGEIVRWWGAEAHALHSMDIDTCHHAISEPHLKDVGFLQNAQFRHAYQHLGSIQQPEEKRHVSGAGSHTFAEGLMDYYHLTGDRRALDIAEGYAHHQAHINKQYKWSIGRSSGWALQTIAGVYRVRPHAELRAAVDAMLDQVSRGVNDVFQHPREVSDRGINLCMRGLVAWYHATGDERAKRLLVDRMETFLKYGFGCEGLPRASNWPESDKPTTVSQGFANLEALACAYQVTGDRRFIDAGVPSLVQAVNWILQPTYKGDFFQRMLRGPFPFMTIADELGLLERVPGVGAWLNPKPEDPRERGGAGRYSPVTEMVSDARSERQADR